MPAGVGPTRLIIASTTGGYGRIVPIERECSAETNVVISEGVVARVRTRNHDVGCQCAQFEWGGSVRHVRQSQLTTRRTGMHQATLRARVGRPSPASIAPTVQRRDCQGLLAFTLQLNLIQLCSFSERGHEHAPTDAPRPILNHIHRRGSENLP